MPPLQNKEYTIGWICALPIEMAAARLMLDKDHGRSPQYQNQADHNIYHLGSIGEHNIAVACLPAGVYGQTSATTVAVQMLSTFESIRFGLMVGIGGGIPSRAHDIRLGDIVVSQPRGNFGGVIQYDVGKNLPPTETTGVGKTVQGGELRRIGSLNKPPLVLLNAIGYLQAEHELEGSRVPQILSEKLGPKSDSVRTQYSYQGAENDDLYVAGYKHQEGEDNEFCELCEGSSRVVRRNRAATDPVIHYGNIASGNQVVKHAMTRDQIGKDLGAICFEMEAAGLMDNFPCLVIRGICDYADSHKNKRWQRCAAANAAAYAKELLDIIPASQVDPTPRIAEILVTVKHDITSVKDKVTDLGNAMEKDEQKRLLDKLYMLPCAQGAALDSNNQRFSPKCHAGTRVEFLARIEEWFEADTHNQVIFWLNGMAGTGKSTIARTIAQSFQNAHRLGASFFFKRGEQDRSHAKILFTTIASQLARNVPSLGPIIARSIESNPGLLSASIDEQFKYLIFQPLSELKHSQTTKSKYSIVIDALDECDNEGEIDLVIHLLSQLGRLQSTKIFLTSRPELPIHLGFSDIEGSYEHAVLTDIEQHIIKHDISVFLKRELGDIRLKHEKCFPYQRPALANWPPEESVRKLADMATPLFIVAATICGMLRNTKQSLQATLEGILQDRNRITEASEIDTIYMTILDQLLTGLSDLEKKGVIDGFQEVVGAIINLATPLSADSLAHLLNIDTWKVNYRLAPLSSVLNIPAASTEPIRLLHLSFRDFLTGPHLQNRKDGRNLFWVNEMQNHKDIAASCLRRLSDVKMPHHLKRNICKLTSPGKPRTKIRQETIEENMPPDVRYACCYWVYHLKQAGDSINDEGPVHIFLRDHFLHWVEALCLLGKSYDIIVHIRDLSSLVTSDGTEVDRFIKDAQRFLLASRSLADMAPLQLYSSALIFSPHNSIIRKTFESQIPKWIQTLPKVDDEWDAVLQELDYWRHHDTDPSQYIDADGLLIGDNREVKLRDSDFMKFSPAKGSNVIALAGNDSMVRLYDSFTGAPIRTLRGHDSPVTVINFSSDGKLLVSGSRDKTVKVWDAVAGTLKLTLEGHEDRVKAVLFSADGSVIFSMASDAMRQWDSETGEPKGVPLRSIFMASEDISFSPDGQLLLSVPNEGEAWFWNFTSRVQPTQALLTTRFEIYEEALMDLSSDGETAVVVRWYGIFGTCREIEISSTATGKRLHTVTSKWGGVQAIAVLPDGKFAAVTMEDKGDDWSGQYEYNYVVFGDLGAEIEPKATSIDVKTWVRSPPITISPDGKLLVFALAGRCSDGSPKVGICVYDSTTGKEIHRLRQTVVAGDWGAVAGQALSPDNKVMASISRSGSVMLHDLETGQLRYNLGSMNEQRDDFPLEFECDHSSDSWQEGDLWLDDQSVLRIRSVAKVRFSRDGTRVAAVAGGVDIVKVWDSGTGQLIETIKGPWDRILGFDFLPSGNLVVLGSENAIRVLESATGKLLYKFSIQITQVLEMAYTAAISPNNNFIAARGLAWLRVSGLLSGAGGGGMGT
ncbi:hypothetical protein TWF481_009842 [Arthrobotrys musiformis]|uniref:Nephrocystin 3-like N-terminal domain-containing protein n=1 Tax=Arthrobotrys musiformis TaxID=47236 RepID=A0AAV9W5Y4_9PEZI